MEKLILAFSDDCMKLLRDFYMSLSLDITPFDLMDYILLFEVIIFWQESQAKDLMKVMEHPNALHDEIPNSSGNWRQP